MNDDSQDDQNRKRPGSGGEAPAAGPAGAEDSPAEAPDSVTTLAEVGGGLTGQLLVAMPGMTDPRFERSVVYLCAHNEEGAMGILINKALDSISFQELLEQLKIEPPADGRSVPVHFGGPVETGRGFVLHTTDWLQQGSLRVDEGVALTATIDVLRDIASGGGPQRHLLALGYAGWGPGQLEGEIQENGWLTVSADETLLFGEDLAKKWNRAIAKLGFDVSSLSSQAGHA